MKKTYRTESDSIGELQVERDAYYGVQTLRAKRNFSITDSKMNFTFVKNIVLIKKAAALVNGVYGILDQARAAAIVSACDEVLAGKHRKEFVVDAVQGGAARVFCIPVAASTAGTIGEVTKTGDGGGSVTVQGSPNNAYALTVRFTAQGGLNTAAFVYSIDGDNFSDEITVPVTGSYEIEGTGLTIKFTEASSPDQKPSSFLVRDTYTLKTTAPSMTNGDVLGAIEKIKSFNEEFEFVHIVGGSTVELWRSVKHRRS